MADRKSFLLRIDATVLEAAQRWANDELRSVNAQIEFILREALKRAGRGPQPPGEPVGRGSQREPAGRGSPGPAPPPGPRLPDDPGQGD